MEVDAVAYVRAQIRLVRAGLARSTAAEVGQSGIGRSVVIIE